MLWFVYMLCFFFFKQKTAYEMRISDWSSDVCSSDLRHAAFALHRLHQDRRRLPGDRRAQLVHVAEGDMVEAVDLGRKALHVLFQIGRASCRERVCQYV